MMDKQTKIELQVLRDYLHDLEREFNAQKVLINSMANAINIINVAISYQSTILEANQESIADIIDNQEGKGEDNED